LEDAPPAPALFSAAMFISVIEPPLPAKRVPENKNRRAIAFDKLPLDKSINATPSYLASRSSFGHSGFTGTFAWADPETGLVFIFLSNRVFPTRNNKKLLKYNIRTEIHSVLYEAINESKKLK